MKTLMIAEHDNIALKPVNAHLLSAVEQLSGQTDVLVAGRPVAAVTDVLRQYPAVRCILFASHAVYEHQLPENLAQLIVSLAKETEKYDFIIMPDTTFGKNVLPRVAALLQVSMISGVTGILSADTFIHSVSAGNVLATIKTSETIKLMTLRGTAFPAANPVSNVQAAIQSVSAVFTNTLSQFVSCIQQASTRPELTAARIVVAGGRGLKNAAGFKKLEAFADSIGAAVGASRAAVDAGLAPNDWQVGQTGKVVAPDLYIAVGISGAIQHLAGMKDSRVIVAINSDPEAPIFQVSDYALVGDLFQILPELQAAWTASPERRH